MSNSISCERTCVVSRLKQLDLSPELLHEAVAAGEIARDTCTSNDPITFPGTTAWARTTRVLRELLAPDGWQRDIRGGLELVVSPNGEVAIFVATGDDATGRSGSSPKTKNPKGTSTATAIEQNQLLLFPEFASSASNSELPVPRTWLLLIKQARNEVRCELSLPKATGKSGKIEEWAERIILDPVPRDIELTVTSAEKEPDIVFEVSRRAR